MSSPTYITKRDEILNSLKDDLFVSCCMNDKCDGYHPRQDKEHNEALEDCKQAIDELVLELIGSNEDPNQQKYLGAGNMSRIEASISRNEFRQELRNKIKGGSN